MIAKYNNKYYNIKTLDNGETIIWTPKETKDFNKYKTKSGQFYYAKIIKPETVDFFELTFMCNIDKTDLYIEKYHHKTSTILVTTHNATFAKEHGFYQENDMWKKEIDIAKPTNFTRMLERVFDGKIEKKKLDTESFIKEYTEMVTSLKLKK